MWARARTARTQREQSEVARQRFETRKQRLEKEATRRKQRLEEKRKTRTPGEQAPKAIKGEIDAILARAESKRQDGKQGDGTS